MRGVGVCAQLTPVRDFLVTLPKRGNLDDPIIVIFTGSLAQRVILPKRLSTGCSVLLVANKVLRTLGRREFGRVWSASILRRQPSDSVYETDKAFYMFFFFE